MAATGKTAGRAHPDGKRRAAPVATQRGALRSTCFTSESPARVRLLDSEQLDAGSEGWVQLLLSEPLPLVKGDYFVVRSSESTLGGGQVVDPNPRRRHRRFDVDVSERLMLLDEGADEDIIVSVAEQWGPCGLTEVSPPGQPSARGGSGTRVGVGG